MHKAQSLNEKQREQRQARRERHSPDDAIFWELGRLDEKVDRIDEKVERLDEKVDRLEIQVAKVYTHISDVRAELKNDIHRTEMQIASLRQELKGDNASLRQELKGDNASLRQELMADNRWRFAILVALMTLGFSALSFLITR